MSKIVELEYLLDIVALYRIAEFPTKHLVFIPTYTQRDVAKFYLKHQIYFMFLPIFIQFFSFELAG